MRKRAELNVGAVLSPDGTTVTVEIGPRHASLADRVLLDLDQATLLRDMLDCALDNSEAEYQEWLARQSGMMIVQLDQGGTDGQLPPCEGDDIA